MHRLCTLGADTGGQPGAGAGRSCSLEKVGGSGQIGAERTGPGQGCIEAVSVSPVGILVGQWGWGQCSLLRPGKNMATLGPRDTPKAWPCFMETLLIGGLEWEEGVPWGRGRLFPRFHFISSYLLLNAWGKPWQVFLSVSVSTE